MYSIENTSPINGLAISKVDMEKAYEKSIGLSYLLLLFNLGSIQGL